MINHEYFELFNKNSVDKQLVISFDGGELTNTELHQQNFELTESICSDSELRFGRCEASEVKFRITNTLPLRNKEIEIKTYLDGDRSKIFSYGKYKVYSDTLTADKMFRDIIAYDKMHEIINMNVADWYNSLDFPINLNTFRNLFFLHVGVGWDIKDGGLMNDDIIIEKTIDPTELSGKTVIEGICELNGCFGRIGRNGRFQFVFLKQNVEGLYPSNTLYPKDDLFPKKVETIDVGKNTYINCTYQDFKTKSIDKLQIRKEENDIGVVVGEGNNTYIIQDNFLVYGKNESDLRTIANRILRNISKISYRPFNANSIGNPCLEPGDVIRLVTRYEMVESYILRRKLKGIQALKDNYSADGKEELSEKVNSVSNTIVQLKGKTNELERTIDETKSTISDVETGLESKITQTASNLSSEIEDTKNGLQSQITQTASNLSSEIEDTKNGLQSQITQTASNLSSEIEDTKNGLQSQITQTASNLSSEIEDTKNGLSSRIEQTIKSITLNISNEEKTAGIVIAFENEKGQKQEVSGKIEMTGIVTFNNLSESGQTVINGSNITTGTINCNLLNGGVIKGQSIEGGTVKGTDITGSTFSGGVFKSESGNYKTEISSGIASTTLIRLIPPASGSGFVPGISRLNQALTGAISGIYFYDDGTVAVDGDLKIGLNATKKLYASAVYSDAGVLGTESVRPTENETISCGRSSYKWSSVYAKDGTINTSDKNLKKDFENFSEQYEDLFFKLTPTLYKFNDGIRKHTGFVSQDVENAMTDCGLTDLDFAGFCRDVKTKITIDEDGKEIEEPVLDEDGKEQYIYSLRYSEFIALNTHMIQKAYEKIEEQSKEIEEMKNIISFLFEKIERLGV